MLGDALRSSAADAPVAQLATATSGVIATAGPHIPREDDQDALQRSTAALPDVPVSGKPEVLIYHRLGSTAGQRAAVRIASEVRKAGGKPIRIRATAQVPATRELRYLRAEDAAEGNKLASQFKGRWGNVWRVAALAPDAGSRRFEIWLPHH
jgi:hypothetical protein